MPGSRRDRAAAPAQAVRLAAAAEMPAPIPFSPPPPPADGVSAHSLGYPTDAEVQAGRPDLLGRVLGEKGYAGGGEERQAARMAAAERHAQASDALPPLPAYRRADAQQAPDGPPPLPLPPAGRGGAR